jgi:predicted TIM-barrel fold metal-dependent hydrolase
VKLFLSLLTITGLLTLMGSAQQSPVKPDPQPPIAAISPFIDVHVHLEKAVADESINLAVQAIRTENIAKYLFLPSPFDEEGPGSFDVEFIKATTKNYSGKIAVSGGGGTLNPMVEQAAHAGKVTPELEKRFRERAEEIARQGAMGFGELTAEHRPSASTPSYQSVPPDQPLFMLLTDIAAAHNMPITLHMEAVSETMPIPDSWHVKPLPNPAQLPANIAAFERLLTHNPRAKIVWAHAGWDNTGARTPELSRRLLRAHPNLYLELKIDPMDPGLNSPLTGGASGAVKPEWLKLFQDFAGRFVIGSDQHYPMPKDPAQRWQAVIVLFNQLPPDLRRKIGTENAIRLYNLKPVESGN